MSSSINPIPIYGMCMTIACQRYCQSFSPRYTVDTVTCAHCCCKDFSHVVNGYVFNNVFTATNNVFHFSTNVDNNNKHATDYDDEETERLYSFSSSNSNSNSGYKRSDVRTPYTGPSIGGSSFSKSLNRTAPLYNIPKHQIQRGQRDDFSLSKRAKKYSSIKEKLLTIVLMDSRRLSKSNRVPNGVAEYAELRKNFQIIDYVTLTTSEAFDNMLGANSFSENWGSYFIYHRHGKLSLIPSAGYCFLNWPTIDILSALNQSKELFVAECCFEDEREIFGLDDNYTHCMIPKVLPKTLPSSFLASNEDDEAELSD